MRHKTEEIDCLIVGFWDGWVQIPSTTLGGSFGSLSLYINPYLAQVKEQGYAIGSLYEQVHVLKMCDHWMKRTGREACGFGEAPLAHSFFSGGPPTYMRKKQHPTPLRSIIKSTPAGRTPPAT